MNVRPTKRKSYITVLSIAGSDSIGGAGVQADIKTCCALGVYAMTAITAVTAQNTRGVHGFEAVSTQMLLGQLEAVAADVVPHAVKIGMLPTAESVEIVAGWIERHSIENVVVDPVLVATSGHSLTSHSTTTALKRLLFPLATIVTPNLPEAHELCGKPEASRPMAVNLAGKMLDFSTAVLIKGGHDAHNGTMTDLLAMRNQPYLTFTHPVVDTINTHGTGCSLSTAIACFMAQGHGLEQSVGEAVDWLRLAITHGADISFGHGHGPVNHNFTKALYKKI